MQNPKALETMTINLRIKTRSNCKRGVSLRRSVVDGNELLDHRDEQRGEARSHDANHGRKSGQNKHPGVLIFELERAQEDIHQFLHRILPHLSNYQLTETSTALIPSTTSFNEVKKSIR